MEQTNVNVQMDVRDTSPVRAVLAGASNMNNIEKFDAESEAKKLLAVMRESGVLPEDMVTALMGDLPALSDATDDEEEVDEKTDDTN